MNTLTVTRQDRLLVLAVHPDDETLGAGGLLQQALAAGAEVRIVAATDGDNNPWPQRLLERHWRITAEDRRRWGQRRRQETLAAMDALGLTADHTTFWGLPDQGLTRILTQVPQSAIALILEEIQRWRPTLLAAPSLQDQHPDHNALAVLIDLALMQLPQQCPKLLTYLVHGSQMLMTSEYGVPLNESQVVHKQQAILSHATQVAFSRGRLLAFAKPVEKFQSAPTMGIFESWHPIQEFSAEADWIHIRIKLTRRLRLWGRPQLTMLSPTHCVRLSLSRYPQTDVWDTASGEVLAQADVRIEDGTVAVDLPRHVFSEALPCYLKLDRRGGFFDLAGWRPAPTVSARQCADIVGIIPCYNVAEFCEQVIRQAVNYVDHLILIDDGSTDNTGNLLARLAATMPDRISVIVFPENRGKGVGLMAGFCEALNRFDFKTLVTLDGDGQHPPAEIAGLVQAIGTGADMAIGGRQLDRMPARSKFGNTVVGGLIRWLYPHAPADTQSGLRAFNHAFTEQIVRSVKGSRYETEIQILLLALSQQRGIATTSIPTIYIDNNRSSKFRPVTDSVRILYALLGWELHRGSKSRFQ